MALACSVWLARSWRGAVFGAVIFIGTLWAGLQSQGRAELDGRVEQERQRQEKFRSKARGWPWWGRMLFFVLAFAVLASAVSDLFS
jgi:CDP-diglyceride synthetase